MHDKRAYRILAVAEKERAIRELETMLDNPDGFDYTLGPPGQLSRILNQNESFDAAVLDLEYCYSPDLAVVSELCELQPHLPLIVLNQQVDVDYSLLALRKGAQDYLEKPHCDSDRLLRSIRFAMERVRHVKKAAQAVSYEPLTGLANRLLLNDRLEQAIKRAARNNSGIAVLSIDLDNFRDIDERIGRRRSDRVLKQVAGRIRNCLRGSDTVARVGGDEFVVVLESVNHVHGASSVARKIIDIMARSVNIDSEVILPSCSVGIALYPQCGDEIEDLISKAELARCCAYADGGNRYSIYTVDMDKEFLHVMNLQNDLAHALERDELSIFYQPKFNLNNGRISGSEALLRWNHPRLGLLLAEDFMHHLEDKSTMLDIGEWMLETACQTNKQWHEDGLCIGPVSVNIADRQLLDDDFHHMVERVLDKTGLPSCLLELEFTENTLINNVEICSKRLQDLRRYGVAISIDDFGSGYCSFDYLRNFLVDTIKIDRSLVEHIGQHHTDAAITAAIVRLARDLKVNVVAEGVDNLEQFKLLFDMSVDEIQGNFLSPAMSPNSTRNYLVTNGLEMNLMFETDLRMAV